jgi:hypothetical protein
MDLSFQNKTQISENFSQQKTGVTGFDGFRDFVTEDSDAVISQIRKIRDQMRVNCLKRQLAKEKASIEKMKPLK